MTIAFYAPLKSPKYPVPSGDRRVARLLMESLKLTGEDIILASEHRSYNKDGSPDLQFSITEIAKQEVQRLIEEFEKTEIPKLWFTYHLYHKAPDLIGPSVAKHFNIPYCLAEASYAPKQLGGPWNEGLEATEVALEQAVRIYNLNPDDTECISFFDDQDKEIIPLKPFLDPAAYDEEKGPKYYWSQSLNLDTSKPWVIAVAMMRAGDKSKSYELLAKSWKNLNHASCQLILVGNGNNQKAIKEYFADTASSVCFAGQLSEREITELLNCCDLFAWPGINEAFGLSIMEAQATGLPVVSANRSGIANIVENGVTGLLCEEGNVEQFTKAIVALLHDKDMLDKMSVAAKKNIQQNHSINSAAEILKQSLPL